MPFMYSSQIIDEVEAAVSGIKMEDVQRFLELLQGANRVFCDGLGRSGLCCRAFAMRLMHLGMTSFFVGDIETPAIEEGDVLLICSGSGQSKSLISHAQKAKERGVKLALITGSEDSYLDVLSDIRIMIAAPEKDAGTNTLLPMGSQFEGAAALLFENFVLELMKLRNETSETMFQRHANLE